MYREILHEFIKNHDYAKLQDPCPAEKIAEAEAYVGYAFPDALKKLLSETDGDHWFLLSAKEIMENVERNRTYFTECFDDAESYEEAIDRHIFFATNGCGDYYGYRVLPNGTVDTDAIYMWEHETFEHHIVAKDILDLIRKYYSDEI